MAKQQRTEILMPVGRLVQGSLYEASETDGEGNLKVYKTGPNIGKPRIDYFFAVAIPKRSEQGWANTEWGQKIYATGVQAFPQGQHQIPTFSWKIRDGDSTIPNTKGKRPCDQAGFPGHWIVGFSSGFSPRLYDAKGANELTQPDLVKLGYYVQVFGTVSGNESTQKPGVYLNHSLVAFSYAGEEIFVGPDASAVGFGQSTERPAGAIDAPAMAPNPFGAQPVQPGTAAPPPMPALPQSAPSVTVQPHTAFMQAPGAALSMPTPPVAPVTAPAARSLDDRRTQSGMAYSIEKWMASGWTEQTLIQHGHISAA